MSDPKLEKVYEYLINDEDARACRAISDSACKVVPGNFIKMVVAQFFTKLGDALINPKVTLPWIMQSIGVPASFIAWLVPIRESGSLIPQLAIASLIRQMPLRKWPWVVGALIQSLSVLGIGLVALLFTGATAGTLIILLLVIFSLARGLSSVAAKDVLGKTIPKKQRGQVNGWSSSSSGLVTLLLAGVMAISYFVDWQGNGVFYALSLIGAAAVWLLGAGVFSLIKEEQGETDGGKNGLLEALKQCRLLWTDKVFFQFVLARTLLLSTALSAPYYVLLAHQKIGNQMWLLALFMFASGMASLCSGPFWGRFADQSSRKVMMLGASLSGLIGIGLFVIAQLAPQWLALSGFLPILYFGICIAHDGVRVGRKTYLVDMSEGNTRTTYVAVSNTVIGVMLLLMSFLGLLTELLALPSLIVLFAVFTFVGVLVTNKLPELSQ